MIKAIDFLSDQERRHILEKIYELKLNWTYRSPMFCTLGTALYLDATSSFLAYQILAGKTNTILLEHFPQLYPLLKNILQRELQDEVVFESSLALPGFHIFTAPQNDAEMYLMKHHQPSIHFDLQFTQAKWPYNNIESNRPISFTAAIKLPSSGGGLNYWDIVHEDYHKLSDDDQQALFQSKERLYCPYQEGKIVIHDGFTLHQIAVPDEVKRDDQRITLQGHAVRCDQVWRVYW